MSECSEAGSSCTHVSSSKGVQNTWCLIRHVAKFRKDPEGLNLVQGSGTGSININALVDPAIEFVHEDLQFRIPPREIRFHERQIILEQDLENAANARRVDIVHAQLFADGWFIGHSNRARGDSGRCDRHSGLDIAKLLPHFRDLARTKRQDIFPDGHLGDGFTDFFLDVLVSVKHCDDEKNEAPLIYCKMTHTKKTIN